MNEQEMTVIKLEAEIDGKQYRTIHKFSPGMKYVKDKKEMILEALDAFKEKINKELS